MVRIKDTYLLIVPKASVSYAKWLEDEGMAGPVQGSSWETALFHDLLDAGIILKAEKARDPWRYAFVNGIPGEEGEEDLLWHRFGPSSEIRSDRPPCQVRC